MLIVYGAIKVKEGDILNNKATKKISKLKEFRTMLETKSRKELIEFYEKYIYNKDQLKTNELKRMLYTLMKKYETNGDIDKSREYYCIYQNFKNKKITYDKAMEKFMNIN